eukprot:jgi/Mesen1/9147/ME000581S08651
MSGGGGLRQALPIPAVANPSNATMSQAKKMAGKRAPLGPLDVAKQGSGTMVLFDETTGTESEKGASSSKRRDVSASKCSSNSEPRASCQQLHRLQR